MLVRTILLFLLVLPCAGCGTAFNEEYYLFSGQIVDAADGKPVPMASVYIAADQADFFQPPADYTQIDEPNATAAQKVFRRKGANRYLFFKADDEGRFVTIWRRDAMLNRFFPLLFFKKPLNKIAFTIGADGYDTSKAEIKRGLFQSGYRSARFSYALEENKLGTIALNAGKAEGLESLPAPIEKRYLDTRWPIEPIRHARPEFEAAEKARHAKQYAEALKGYEAAMAKEAEPEHAWLMMKRLDMLFMLGRYDETLSYGESYLAKYPNVGFVHKIMADAAYKLRRQDVNRAHLIKAMQLDPEFMPSFENLTQLDLRYAIMPDGWPTVYHIWK